jgi:hypothetical protein
MIVQIAVPSSHSTAMSRNSIAEELNSKIVVLSRSRATINNLNPAWKEALHHMAVAGIAMAEDSVVVVTAVAVADSAVVAVTAVVAAAPAVAAAEGIDQIHIEV